MFWFNNKINEFQLRTLIWEPVPMWVRIAINMDETDHYVLCSTRVVILEVRSDQIEFI